MKKKFIILTILSIIFIKAAPKIVGLIPVRNEEKLIEICLRSLSFYTDSIIVLDDASQDNTLKIIESLKHECRIEKIIRKKIWKRDELGDKKLLLSEGRKIGGTHFIVLDADEIFTSCCSEHNWLRTQILKMKPGQVMSFPMVNLWNDIFTYRDDEIFSPKNKKWIISCVFCDDGKADYCYNKAAGPSKTIHVARVPKNINNENSNIIINNLNHCLIHFKMVNLIEMCDKRAWYMCLEFIGLNKTIDNKKSFAQNAQIINQFYYRDSNLHINKDGKIYYRYINHDKNMIFTEKDIATKKIPSQWYKYYYFINPEIFNKPSISRRDDIIKWFNKFGINYFSELNIWDIDWISRLRNI